MNKIKKTAIMIAIPVVIILLAVIIRISVVSQEKFSLAKFAIINVSGVNGHGKATTAVDEIGLYAALAGSNASADQKNKYYDFVSSVQISLDRSELLSNNDELKVTVSYDEKVAEKLGIQVDIQERTQRVSGLMDGSEVDLFADFKLITSGVSPFISISYKNESANSYIAALEYTLSQTTNLKLGDSVKVTCNADEAAAAAQGYFFEGTELELEITTADRYVDNIDDVPSDVLESILAQDIEALQTATQDKTYHMSYAVTKTQTYLYRDNNEETVNLNFIGSVIAENAIEALMDHQNYVLLFLKGQVRMANYNGSDDPYDYIDAYFCFLYSDAIIRTDNSFSMATNNPIERFVCGATYEDCLQEAMDRIGAGYQYQDFKED